MNCSKKDCPHQGTHSVTLLVYADTKHEPLEMMMGVSTPGQVPSFQVCRWHAKELLPVDILSEPGKLQIENALRQAGKARPDWTLTKVQTKDISRGAW